MLKGSRKKHYQFLSVLLTIALVVSLLSPAKIVHAATAPVFTKTSQNILEGETYTLTIKNKIASAKYTWQSSDKSIATVNKEGNVTGIKKGTAVISCNIKASKATYTLKCKVSVKKPATQILIKNKIDYLLVGEAYDLNRLLVPASSNDITTWSSSNPSVISPDKSGRFTAAKVGFATITATTLSKVSDSVTIYVVEEEAEKITSADVIDGKVKLADKSYGNLTITNSVGDARIELSNITVGGTLTMESGAAYTVVTDECTINKVAAVNKSEVSSFAMDDSEDTSNATPSLIAGNGSLIVTIDSECNISVRQTNGATIQSFSVVTKDDGSIEIELEGFKGDLIIDSQSQSDIKIATTACEMSSATVKSATEGQSITLTDNNAGTDKASTIQTVNMEANAALTVNVKTEEVKVAKEVSQADVVIQQPVTKLTNEGNNTSLMINSQVGEVNSIGEETQVSLGDAAQVQNLTVAGSNTNVELQTGATVTSVTSSADNTRVTVSEGSSIQSVTTYGNNASVEGSGTVEQAVVTGNDSQVNTQGTQVQVATGTTNVSVGGVEVKEEDKVAIVTPTPTPAPTQAPNSTATPTPKATVTPKPTVTVAPSPTPTSGPITPPPYTPPTVTPRPTTTPRPTATPTVSPIPNPTNAEMLEEYNEILGALHVATLACLDNSSAANLGVVKNKFNALKDKLDEYDDLDPEYTDIETRDEYLFDYAEYFEVLVDRGADYGLPIRVYYENATSETETLEMAIAAANRTIHMVYRLNDETSFFEENVNNVFDTLDGSQAEFHFALNKLITDAEEFTGFTLEDAGYYQTRMLERILTDDFIRGFYEAGEVNTFWSAINCFIIIINMYGEELGAFENSELYKELVDDFIEAMPELTIYTWTDEDGTERYGHAEFDPEADISEVIAVMQETFDRVDLQPFFGEDVTEFTIEPLISNLIVRDLAWHLGNFETYEDGSVEILNYYAENHETIDQAELPQVLYQCIQSMLYTTYGSHQWNEWYLNEYQNLVDGIIDAANNDDEEALYLGLVELYDKKMSEEGTAEEWSQFDSPSYENEVSINMDYCIELIKAKLLPLSEMYEDIPVNSRLFNYDNAGSELTSDHLDQAIYDLVDVVRESQQWFMDMYDDIKDMVLGLMSALESDDADQTYDIIHQINDLAISTGNTDGVIKGEEYIPVYHRIFRSIMFSDDEGQALKVFYDIYRGLEENQYSRYISERANDVIWATFWWLLGSEEAESQLLEEYDLQNTWSPVVDSINTVLYDADTENERVAALQTILDFAKLRPELINNYFGNDFDIESVVIDSENLSLYMEDILTKVTDGTMDSDEQTGDSWYRYGCYEYDQNKQNNIMSPYYIVEKTGMEFLWSVIDTNNEKMSFILMNDLMEALINEDAVLVYDALGDMNEYILHNIGDSDSILLDEVYAEAYLLEMKFWTLSDEYNDFQYYLSLYQNFTGDDYSAETANAANNALGMVRGLLSEGSGIWFQNKFSNTDEEQILLDAILQAMPALTVYSITDEFGVEHFDRVEYSLLEEDKETILSAIQNLFDQVELELFDMTALTMNPIYADMMIDELAVRISYFEPYQNGLYSNLYDYSLNETSMTASKRMVSIHECINDILWSMYSIQTHHDNYIDNYKNIIDGIISAASGDDYEAMYQGLLALFQAKMSEGEQTAQEWSEYLQPGDENASYIKKEYCSQIIQSKLLELSEINDGVPANSRLYTYLQNQASPNLEQLDGAIYELKDIVWESDLWYYDTYQLEKGMVNGLVDAIEAQDAAQLYQVLSVISSYFIDYEGMSTNLLSEEYSNNYLSELTVAMNSGEESALNRFYNMHLSFTGDDYSRDIANTAHIALWEAEWFLTEDGAELIEYKHQQPITMNNRINLINEVLYVAVTGSAITVALDDLIAYTVTDAELMEHHFSLNECSGITANIDLVVDYRNWINSEINNDLHTVDPVTGETYYASSLYLYNGCYYDGGNFWYELVEHTYANIVWAIININNTVGD